MTKYEIEDIVEVLKGYDNWVRQKQHAIENGSDNQLSTSAYLDDYAKMRAVEILQQIQEVYANPELPWQEVDAEIRRLVGVQS